MQRLQYLFEVDLDGLCGFWECSVQLIHGILKGQVLCLSGKSLC